MKSCPSVPFGKAITSLIEFLLHNIAISRSNPENKLKKKKKRMKCSYHFFPFQILVLNIVF